MTIRLAIDTECTGLDLYHGARPYLVTLCYEGQHPVAYEWDVDPLTRRVDPHPQDLAEIQGALSEADEIIGHNIKYDVTAMRTILPDYQWPWDRTYDTLMASHILGSILTHNLTDVVRRHLRINILPLEQSLKKACVEARAYAKKHLPDWRLAKEGLPDMPSVKGDSKARDKGGADERPWKNDGWLPKALFNLWHIQETESVGLDHPWRTVLRDYAVTDSASTIALWPVMREKIEQADLWDNFVERMHLPRLAHDLERRGVTVRKSSHTSLGRKYHDQATELQSRCVNIAKSFDYDLTLPRSGRNQSLDTFAFDVMKLPVLGHTRPKKTEPKPIFDKNALGHYEVTLPDRSRQLYFCKALSSLRKKQKALEALSLYGKFALDYPPDPNSDVFDDYWILHPSINPAFTGTTRWSSTNPSEQTISKQADEEGYSLRDVFCPPPGYELWSLDAKNIELRIPFYVCGEEVLIELFEQPDKPPYYGSNHLANFHAVYPDIWDKELREVGFEKVGPHCKKKYAATWYQWCKNGGFAKQYGGGRAKVDATFRRAGAYDLLDSKFGRLAGLNRQKIQEAEKYGYVETMPRKGRRRGYPLMCTRTEHHRILTTVPLSYFVQGTAMEWTNEGMVNCDVQLTKWRKAGFDAYMFIQQHDEIVFAMPKGGDPRADIEKEKSHKGKPYFRTSNWWRVRVLQRIMEGSGKDLNLPTPVGIEYHDTCWGKGITLN